jgi:peptidoglycan/xylan/chitin deacetylase (PgdA/CDA1 family)
LIQKPITVLMYHHISREKAGSSLILSPQSFSRQIEWLQKWSFQFLTLDEVLQKKMKVPLWNPAVALTFDDGFRDNYENAFPLLIQEGIPAALFVVVNWVGERNFMNWNEIRELSRAGVLIGSHSMTHRWLPDISNDQELGREIFDSKKKIEDEIGKEVDYFCYPVGGVNARVAETAKKAGYRAAWVAGARPTVQIQDRSYALRRVKVSSSDSSPLRFALKSYGIKSLLTN